MGAELLVELRLPPPGPCGTTTTLPPPLLLPVGGGCGQNFRDSLRRPETPWAIVGTSKPTDKNSEWFQPRGGGQKGCWRNMRAGTPHPNRAFMRPWRVSRGFRGGEWLGLATGTPEPPNPGQMLGPTVGKDHCLKGGGSVGYSIKKQKRQGLSVAFQPASGSDAPPHNLVQ